MKISKIDKDHTEFTIKITMKNRWIPHFLAMLKYMEQCGRAGCSRAVGLYADGDGDFHPKFEWSDELNCDAKPVKDNDGDHLYDAG